VPKLARFSKPFLGGWQGLSRRTFASIFCIAQALEKAGAGELFKRLDFCNVTTWMDSESRKERNGEYLELSFLVDFVRQGIGYGTMRQRACRGL
jgi:hypothetical protein